MKSFNDYQNNHWKIQMFQQLGKRTLLFVSEKCMIARYAKHWLYSFPIEQIMPFDAPLSSLHAYLINSKQSGALSYIPASILRKSTSGRHRPVSYSDGPMTARYRFT